MPLIPFAPYMPDLSAVSQGASFVAENVTPSSGGYLPVAGLVTTTNGLTARCQGAFSVRGLTGIIHNFCGDAGKLYHLSANGLTWNDVTRTTGGAYQTAQDGWWSFTIFGDLVIATNGVDVPQSYQLDVSTNFTALAGSPPSSIFAGNIRDFAVLARKNTNWNRMQWSAINNAASWTPSATTMADVQDFPDGGAIMGFVGGEYGVVLMERSIYRMAFEGPPTVFRFDRIATTLGCRVEQSVAAYQDLVFFLSNDGFYMIRGGSEITPIGAEKVDRWLEANFNAALPHRCSAAIDPIRKIYTFAFPSSVSTGDPDIILVYHWPSGQWSTIRATVQYMLTGATQTSYTLDSLDSLSASVDLLPYPLDSRFYTGSGRLLLSGFDTSNKSGYFSGPNLAATIETGDTRLNDSGKALLKGFRPIMEGATLHVSAVVKSRDHQYSAYDLTPPVQVNAVGYCPFRVNARYHRTAVMTTVGDNWKFAVGIDEISSTPTGNR